MDRYLVFGHPVRHSKSPFIHTLFARQTQQELEYGLAEPAVDEFAATLRSFFALGGKGCNVTVPFKEQAFALVDRLSPRAKRAGAVNTIKLTDDGVLLGDNTDGAGLVADLKSHGVTLAGSRILLLGAGGAARGALAPLLAEKPGELVIANRTPGELRDVILHYRDGLLPILAPLTLLKHYLAEYPDRYLMTQNYFDPYPDDLGLRLAVI